MPGGTGGGGGGPIRFSHLVIIARVMGCFMTVGATASFCAHNTYNRRACATQSVTEGVVQKAEMTEYFSKKRNVTDYTGVVTYKYEIDGKSHIRTGYYPGADALHESAHRVQTKSFVSAAMAPFQKGASVKVYYDPSAPEHSTLERPVGTSAASNLPYLIFAMAGVGFILVAHSLIDRLWASFSSTGH